ncbi:MAG: hypothetical protein E7310_01060 [Clostridiales bacterium]|nr:hypothetical protein [Clostridiales bacterium]
MNSKIMKNIVVLKDLPSNIIDEAIVILKDNSKIKSLEAIEKKELLESKNKTIDNKEYILKEAEMVISNYISDIKEEKQLKSLNVKALEKQCKRLKRLLAVVGILAFLGIVVQFV